MAKGNETNRINLLDECSASENDKEIIRHEVHVKAATACQTYSLMCINCSYKHACHVWHMRICVLGGVNNASFSFVHQA